MFAVLEPHLADWIALWQQAAPAVTAASLERSMSGPFTLTDIRAYNPRSFDATRRRSLFGAWAPDSARVVDADTSLDITPERNAFHRGAPDISCAALIDLKINSIATLDTCGASCDFDGALWISSEQFALTGTTAADDTTGSRRGFVRLYDLAAGTVTEYRTPPVIPSVYARFATIREVARTARLRRLTR